MTTYRLPYSALYKYGAPPQNVVMISEVVASSSLDSAFTTGASFGSVAGVSVAVGGEMLSRKIMASDAYAVTDISALLLSGKLCISSVSVVADPWHASASGKLFVSEAGALLEAGSQFASAAALSSVAEVAAVAQSIMLGVAMHGVELPTVALAGSSYAVASSVEYATLTDASRKVRIERLL